jgi:hypothetical protein
VASSFSPGACLAVPLHEAVTPPLARPIMITSILSNAPKRSRTGRVPDSRDIGFELLALSCQCPVYDMMVSRPLSLPSGASTTTPIPSARGSSDETSVREMDAYDRALLRVNREIRTNNSLL